MAKREPLYPHVSKSKSKQLYARYEGYKPQWEGFVNISSGDILQTSCGHGARVGPDRLYIIIEPDGHFHCYCEGCEKEIIKQREVA